MHLIPYVLSNLIILFSSFNGPFSQNMTLNYFEYNRGLSLPTVAQIHISSDNGWDYTFHILFSICYRLMLFKTEKIPAGIIQPYVSFGAGPDVPHMVLMGKFKQVL